VSPFGCAAGCGVRSSRISAQARPRRPSRLQSWSASAIAIIPFIGVTTVLCLVAGRLFRLNHVVMQIINHSAFPLQVLLIVPFVRLGETLSGSRHFALTPKAIFDEFNRSIPDFMEKFWLTGLHGFIGWAVTVPLACWLLHLILRRTFRRLLPKPATP